ncbi:hypothetical protein BJ878DRAFT_539546 [Calycina marina]|uniref:2EXR domain-containing protein n=1 Tax=Calycina marina TaxID=1763456 RepID=A0A9P7Z7Z5_9HELO|nr:hypothetical protein BJ878DRAFT_539546 [Calycina marina]
MAMPRTRPKTPVNDPVLYYNVSRVAKQVPASTHQVSCQPHCSYENQETSRKPAPRPVYSSKDWQKKINNPVSTKQTEKRSNATTTKPTAVVLKIDENIRTVEQELTPLSVPKLEKLLVKLGPVKICADFPSIASWDTIPSAWDRWARKNLNPTCYQTLLPYILDGSLDHGFWPKGLRDYDAKGCFRNAKFHRFGELPTEIKKEIWKYALANNNHVARVTVHFDRVQQGPKFFRVNHAFRSANGGPPLLQTCCLSRVLAQQYYELAFATEANDAMCFVNFDTSRIFLNTRNRDDIQAFKKHLPAVDLEFIRHLVLPIRDFLIGDWASACDIWKKCTNLEHLTLLVGNSKEDSVADAASEAYRVRKYVRRWWVGKHEGKAVPEVELVRISAVKARLYRIDDLIYS